MVPCDAGAYNGAMIAQTLTVQAPRSPWPDSPSAPKAPRPPDAPQDGIKLGLAGKVLGVLMDMPRPTRNKKLSAEQVEEIRASLQPGDVLLETNDEYPGWQVNAKLFLKSDWVHAALYVGNDKIIDSTTERNGVAETTLKNFSNCHHLAVIRPSYKSEADRQAALQYARDKIGTPYDFDWNLSNNTLYCTEFVANALAAGPNPIKIDTMKAVGQEMVSPRAFLENSELKTVWTTGSNYWLNFAQRARPFLLQSALGVGAGVAASALGAGPALATAAGVVVGGGLFLGSMWRIYKRDNA